jgi:hypothetical protein
MTNRIERKAEDRLDALSPSAPDVEVAEALASCYVARCKALGWIRKIRLSIFHDVRKRSNEGPCPLPFDWSYKNVVGIETDDEELARLWAREALLKGYSVFYGTRRGGGVGGSINHWRRLTSRRRS